MKSDWNREKEKKTREKTFFSGAFLELKINSHSAVEINSFNAFCRKSQRRKIYFSNFLSHARFTKNSFSNNYHLLSGLYSVNVSLLQTNIWAACDWVSCSCVVRAHRSRNAAGCSSSSVGCRTRVPESREKMKTKMNHLLMNFPDGYSPLTSRSQRHMRRFVRQHWKRISWLTDPTVRSSSTSFEHLCPRSWTFHRNQQSPRSREVDGRRCRLRRKCLGSLQLRSLDGT